MLAPTVSDGGLLELLVSGREGREPGVRQTEVRPVYDRPQKRALGLGSEVGVGLLVADVWRQRSVLEEVVALGSSPVGLWIGLS